MDGSGESATGAVVPAISAIFSAGEIRSTVSYDWASDRHEHCAGVIRRQRVSRMRGFRHWRRHLDEMYVKLDGEMVYLWRAVDKEGEVLESCSRDRLVVRP